MVVREWRARASAENASLYPRHFRDAVLARLRNVAGFVAATLIARELHGHIEFVVVTRWQSLECIRDFAGANIDEAVVEPEAAAALTSFDHAVQHYHVIEDFNLALP